MNPISLAVVIICCVSVSALTTQLSGSSVEPTVYTHKLAMFGASRPVSTSGVLVLPPQTDLQLCNRSSVVYILNTTGPIRVDIFPPPGPVVFALRGGCMFSEKAQIAQAAGAKALVIVNYGPYTTPMGAVGDTSALTLAVVSIGSTTFAAIKKELVLHPNVAMTVQVNRNGDEDENLIPPPPDSDTGSSQFPPRAGGGWGSGGGEEPQPQPLPRGGGAHDDDDDDNDDDDDDDTDRVGNNKDGHFQRERSGRITGFIFMCVIITVLILLICCCCRRRRQAAATAAAAAGGPYAMLPHHMQYRGTPQYDPYSQAMQPMQVMQPMQPLQPMQPMQFMQPVQSAGGAPIYYYPMPQPQQAQAPRVVVVHTPQVQPSNGQPHSAAQQLA